MRLLEHVGDDGPHAVDVARNVRNLQVDVSRRSTRTERGEQHATLEDQVISACAQRQPCEESFERVQHEQFVGRPSSRARRCSAR